MSRRNLLKIAGCWALAPTVTAAAPKSSSSAAAGVVLGMKGAPRDFLLLRNGQPVPVTLWLALQPADVMEVHGAGELTLMLADGHTYRLAASDGQVVVPARTQSTIYLTNAIELLGAKVTRLREAQSSSLGSRAGPTIFGDQPEFAFTDLRAGRASIRAGPRPFGLGWRGGFSPYRVIVGARDNKLVDEAQVDGHLLILTRPLPIARGRYDVTLIDAKGQTDHGSFLATDAWRGPTLAEALGRPETLQLEAAHLLVAEPPLTFEAFLTLVAAVPTQPEALSFMAGLVEGTLP